MFLFLQVLRARLAVFVQIRNHRYKKCFSAGLWFCVLLASCPLVAVFRSLSPRILASSTAGIFERMIPKIITAFRYHMTVTFILVMRLDPKQTPIEQTEFFDDLVRCLPLNCGCLLQLFFCLKHYSNTPGEQSA